MRESHLENYGNSKAIGKIRAHGRFSKKSPNLPGVDNKPIFQGWCQAAGTGDSFRIVIWQNENDFRFEIVESKPYYYSTVPF